MPVRSSALVLVAFLATLVAYVVLTIYDRSANPRDTLEAVLLIEVGALAGVSVPGRTTPT